MVACVVGKSIVSVEDLILVTQSEAVREVGSNTERLDGRGGVFIYLFIS